MVGVNISYSYFHPGGAHITRVKIISHTGIDLVEFLPVASSSSSIRF